MRVWRLTKPELASGMDGEGARLWGGRWNSPGLPMVYPASSLALAVLDYYAHLPPQMRLRSALPELAMHDLELSIEQLNGKLTTMSAVITGHVAIMERLETIVSRHENHLLDGSKR